MNTIRQRSVYGCYKILHDVAEFDFKVLQTCTVNWTMVLTYMDIVRFFHEIDLS